MRCSSCWRSGPVPDAVRIATPLADAPRPATLTQRASLNVVASLLDYGAKVAVGLVVVPILVGGLGRSLYGVWEMLGRLVGDRKSTRLNSSHLVISYAVFCLKKK